MPLQLFSFLSKFFSLLFIVLKLARYGVAYIFGSMLKCFGIFKKHNPFYKYDQDIYRSPSEMLLNKGYPLEEHKISTEDFYILTVIFI